MGATHFSVNFKQVWQNEISEVLWAPDSSIILLFRHSKQLFIDLIPIINYGVQYSFQSLLEILGGRLLEYQLKYSINISVLNLKFQSLMKASVYRTSGIVGAASVGLKRVDCIPALWNKHQAEWILSFVIRTRFVVNIRSIQSREVTSSTTSQCSEDDEIIRHRFPAAGHGSKLGSVRLPFSGLGYVGPQRCGGRGG